MRDEASYVAFVEARWPSLLRLAHLLSGYSASGEDVLQAVLLEVYLRWGRISRLDFPEGYVRTMLVDETLSRGRTRTRRGEHLVEAVPERHVGLDDDVEERQAPWPAVRALPPRQRAVIVLRYYEDLSEAEIVQVLGCAPGTVKSQAADALRSLRAVLGATPFVDPSGARHDPA